MPSPIVLDASPEHIAYALLGCFIIFFGLVSLFVKEKLFISEAFVATAFGIIIGPYAIGIFDPSSWNNYDKVTLEFTRIVIAVQVMAAGVSLPRSYMVKERRSLFMMIVPLMILMWLTSALLIWGLIPDLDFVEAMVLAACVTPTDPVLSNSVVKGRFAEKHVPPRIRYLLSAESGINDGMGLPFLFLGLYLMRERNKGTAIAKWFYITWVYNILLSVVLGGLIGAAARKLVKGAKNRNLIDKESFLVFSIALALAVTGCVSILNSDDLLACFIAGNVFAWDDWFSNEIVEAHIQEIIDMLLNLACFVYIGASIPFSKFHDPAIGLSVWRLIVLAILILLFRRLPFVVALKPFIPALSTRREAAFAGWFGPIGVGAVFFSKVTAGLTNPNNLGENPHNVERLLRVRAVIYPIVMFLVLSSVLIHGVTVPLLHLQYKYTRTWSRKREESSHAVTRLPHINIGDEIVLRPPTTMSGSSIGGLVEGAAMLGGPGANSVGGSFSGASVVGGPGGSFSGMSGVGPLTDLEQQQLQQRALGYDPQRSIGYYDHQRSLNQRSLGTGGFGIAGDLSRTSTNNARTLEDVVQEMKEAAKGNKGIRSPNFAALNAGVGSGAGGGGNGKLNAPNATLHPLTLVHSADASSQDNVSTLQGDRLSLGTAVSHSNSRSGSSDAGSSSGGGVIETLRESHPASQGLNILPASGNTSIYSNPSSSGTGQTPQPPSTTFRQYLQQQQLQQLQQQHQHQHQQRYNHLAVNPDQEQHHHHHHGEMDEGPQNTVIKIHEVEREEDNGVIRTVSHDIEERDRVQIQEQLEDQAAREGHHHYQSLVIPSSPTGSSTSSSSSSAAARPSHQEQGQHHLGGLFNAFKKDHGHEQHHHHS